MVLKSCVAVSLASLAVAAPVVGRQLLYMVLPVSVFKDVLPVDWQSILHVLSMFYKGINPSVLGMQMPAAFRGITCTERMAKKGRYFKDNGTVRMYLH